MKYKKTLKYLLAICFMTLCFAGCNQTSPSITQSLKKALYTSNFTEYSTTLNVSNIVDSIKTTSTYNFITEDNLVKFECTSSNPFSVYFIRQSYLDLWDFYSYNYPLGTNTLNLGYDLLPEDTSYLSTLSTLCGRFNISVLSKEYFTYTGLGWYEINSIGLTNLKNKTFVTDGHYGIQKFNIKVVDNKIAEIFAVYDKYSSSDYMEYNIFYSYESTSLTVPNAFINSVNASASNVTFTINENNLLGANAFITKIMLFESTEMPTSAEEYLSISQDSDVALTSYMCAGAYTLINGHKYTIRINAKTVGSDTYDSYQTTFIYN